MAINYAALQTELTTDPNGYGYAPMITSGNDSGLADAVNLVRGSISIDRGVVDSYEIIDATEAADWAALTAGEKQRYQTITGAGRVNLQNTRVRSSFQAMFGPATATRANLIAILTRTGSRVEQLFGAGASVHFLDIARALRG